MNKSIEQVLDTLNGLIDEMTYSAYSALHDEISLLDDLLKEQEARVMSADEIVLSTDPSKWLWIERKGDYCAEAFKAGKTISGLIAFDSETPGAFLYCERPDEYGKTWRCWTSRPTDEQREAVKWDD